MKTFDLVKLPEKEASALMWIRMSLLSALISEHRFLIFSWCQFLATTDF